MVPSDNNNPTETTLIERSSQLMIMLYNIITYIPKIIHAKLFR